VQKFTTDIFQIANIRRVWPPATCYHTEYVSGNKTTWRVSYFI